MHFIRVNSNVRVWRGVVSNGALFLGRHNRWFQRLKRKAQSPTQDDVKGATQEKLLKARDRRLC